MVSCSPSLAVLLALALALSATVFAGRRRPPLQKRLSQAVVAFQRSSNGLFFSSPSSASMLWLPFEVMG